MANPLPGLRERLLRAGVAPRHVRRFLVELEDHWSDLLAEEEGAGRSRAEAEAAALLRLGTIDDLAKAMIDRRQFRSLFARAPWAMFTVGPLLLLAGCYLIACCYLWLGWRMFLPGAETPFAFHNSSPLYGFSNIYFQAGKYFYWCAPVLAGWTMALMTARQRTKSAWLAFGLMMISWMGATAEIHAGRGAVPGGLGHIRMSFFTIGNPQGITYGGLLIFCFSALPYFAWRVRRALAPPA